MLINTKTAIKQEIAQETVWTVLTITHMYILSNHD